MSLLTFWLISCLIFNSWIWVSSTCRSFIALTVMSSIPSSWTFSMKFSISTVVAMKFTRKA